MVLVKYEFFVVMVVDGYSCSGVGFGVVVVVFGGGIFFG